MVASSLPLLSFSRDFIFSSCLTVADSSEDMVALLLVSCSIFALSFAVVSCWARHSVCIKYNFTMNVLLELLLSTEYTSVPLLGPYHIFELLVAL